MKKPKDFAPLSLSVSTVDRSTAAVARAQRRRYTARYKLRILSEADQSTAPGAIGALLRREGLFASHLTAWRRQRKAGSLLALTAHKRGPKSKHQPLAKENQKLQRANQRLIEQLRRAEIIIDVQKKVAVLLRTSDRRSRSTGDALMQAVTALAPSVGTQAACHSLGVARGSFYRQRSKPVVR